MKYPSCCIESNCPKYKHSEFMDEIPVRDGFKKCPCDGPDNVSPGSPPPEPPGGPWELHYCKWWGWTWAKKPEKTQQQTSTAALPVSPGPADLGASRAPMTFEDRLPPSHRKKKKKSWWCWKQKRQRPDHPQPILRNTPSTPVMAAASAPAPAPKPPETKSSQSESSDCCCECCPCNQMVCCCCCGDLERNKPHDPEPNQPLGQSHFKTNATQYEGAGRNRETQTNRSVREQATKMSETRVGKHKNRARPCRCMKMRCCACMRNVCCPCVVVCPCRKNEAVKQIDSSSSSGHYYDAIANLCLGPELPNFKTTNFSTLHKSLDILLRNNMNIMGLFGDKKLSRDEHTAPNSNHTINSLSVDNNEHCKLLTAVGDAILSSHKFENGNSLRVSESSSTQNSLDKEILERILNDGNEQREIGVQVSAPTQGRVPMFRSTRIPLFKKGGQVKFKKRNPKIEKVASVTDIFTAQGTQPSLTMEAINKLLQFVDSRRNTEGCGGTADRGESFFDENPRSNVNLLDTTSPPFTDCELPFCRGNPNQRRKT